MADLFGHAIEAAPFKDIRNQRESVANEKARLCHELNTILRKAPRALGTASIQRVREYRTLRVCLWACFVQSKGSSRQELKSAINTMRGFESLGGAA